MNQIVIILFSLILLSGCARYIPLTHIYEKSIEDRTIILDNSERYWNNLIDFCVKYNIPISLIDKSSGLLISDNVSLYDTLITREIQPKLNYIHNHSPIMNPKSWIISGYWLNGVDILYPNKCNVIITIRIREENKTKITVQINNINCVVSNTSNWKFDDAQSTGILEKIILHEITK
jgi:hypothetical protein